MGTDNEIKIKGFMALIEKLGEVEAEKFISLMKKEPFDYTEWRKDLFQDMDVRQLSEAAMKYRVKYAGKKQPKP